MKFLVVFITLLFLIFTPLSASAGSKPSTNISVKNTYNKAKKSIQTTFGNLSNVKKISYTLMYEGNGIGQGAVGSFSPGKNKSVSRNFLLGTCSRKVCTYHKNVKNIILEVSTSYKNGKTSKQTYKIK